MVAARWGSVIAALFILVSSSSALAKDNDRDAGRDNGPAFCRNGEGHPVFGWEWCRERGFDRAERTAVARTQDRPIYGDRGRDVYDRRGGGVAFNNGYSDGYEKGLDDGHDRDRFDPTRHKWYRSADRHYESRYGSRTQYANVYRDGFRRGYEAGYRDGDRYNGSRQTNRFPRPF